MQNDSSSDESTAASAPKLVLHKCPHCHKVFTSGRALGGHQNAHRKDKVIQLGMNITIETHDENVQPPPAPVVCGGSALEAKPKTGRGHGSWLTIGGSAAAAAKKYHYYHPYARPVGNQKPLLQYPTKDLLREWMPGYMAWKGGNLEISCGKTTSDFNILKGVGEVQEVGSKENVGLDLDLRLGSEDEFEVFGKWV